MKRALLVCVLSFVSVPVFAQKPKPPTAEQFQALVDQVAAQQTQIATLNQQVFNLNGLVGVLRSGAIGTVELAGTWVVMSRGLALHSTPQIGEDFGIATMVLQSNGSGTITFNRAETKLHLTVPATLEREEETVSAPFTWGFDGRLVTLMFSDGGQLQFTVAAGGHALLGGTASTNGPNGSWSDIWTGIKLPPQ